MAGVIGKAQAAWLPQQMNTRGEKAGGHLAPGLVVFSCVHVATLGAGLPTPPWVRPEGSLNWQTVALGDLRSNVVRGRRPAQPADEHAREKAGGHLAPGLVVFSCVHVATLRLVSRS